MEFKKGDLVMAVKLPRRINAFENGDIIQITEKISDNHYNVKVVYKIDNKDYNGDTCWGLGAECKYFKKL